jgi:arsenate reductase
MIKSNTAVFHSIENEIRSFQFGNIPPERKTILQPLIDFIQEKVDKEQEIRLNFICTHIQGEVIYRRSGHKRQQHTSM